MLIKGPPKIPRCDKLSERRKADGSSAGEFRLSLVPSSPKEHGKHVHFLRLYYKHTSQVCKHKKPELQDFFSEMKLPGKTSKEHLENKSVLLILRA